MGWETVAISAVVVLLLFGFILLIMRWNRDEAATSAISNVKEKATADTLEAQRRGDERETEFRELDRDARFERLRKRWRARHPEGVPGTKPGSDSGTS